MERQENHTMLFAISDIHGCYEAMEKRINQIKPLLDDSNNKLLLLGDYIDRGRKSCQCLQMAHDLEQEYGRDKVIVLKGNHEVWFEEFLFENEDVWLDEDENFGTSGTFMTSEEIEMLKTMSDRDAKISYMKKCVKGNHKHLLSWMRKLRLYYEAETQIFVHAGVDETIPEDEIEWCAIRTPDYVLTGKYPPSTGHFYKDIIAGHVAAASVAMDRKFRGIYFDGKSHYYIDGSVLKNRRLLCLAYDENKKQYYEFTENGDYKYINKPETERQIS